jgi:hypothetical protein
MALIWLQDHLSFLRFRLGLVALTLSLTLLPVDAQVFGEGGLFNRNKKDSGLTPDQIGVPSPKSGRVEALKGHEVSFEIVAEAKTPGSTVEFLIRTFPSAGKIVSMVSKPSERNKAVVTYHADPSSSATSDVFTFAVRYRGGRYSAAVRYDIDLVDHKAEIVVTEGLDFGEVMIGDESVGDIVVANSGGATFSRQLIVGAPWHILSPADGKLAMGPGERRAIKVAFRPERRGEASYVLGFNRSRRGSTKLEGVGKPSFEIVNQELELVMNEEANQREGELILVNHSSKPIRVVATASTRLEGSLKKDYFLAPGKETPIPVSLLRADLGPFAGSVQFRTTAGDSQTAKVVSRVAPGRIELTVPNALSAEVVNFGKVEGGRSVERQMTVSNIGGLPVPLEFHIPEPFRLLNQPSSSLAPLSSVDLAIGLNPTQNFRGSVDVLMKVSANGQSISTRLLGNVIKPEGMATTSGGDWSSATSPLKGLRLSSGTLRSSLDDPAPSQGSAEEVLSDVSPMPTEPSTERSKVDHEINQQKGEQQSDKIPAKMTNASELAASSVKARKVQESLRSPEDLSLFSSESNEITIGWTTPRDSENYTFEVELLGMFFAEGGVGPVAMWMPHEAVEMERIGRLMKARILELSPASNYEFRIFMIDEIGQSSAASKVIKARTSAPMDWTYIYLALIVVALIGLGYGIYRMVRNRGPAGYEAEQADL